MAYRNGVTILRAEVRGCIDAMTDADAGALVKALMAYSAGECVDACSLPYGAAIVLPIICAQIDRANEAYETRVENGRRGGRKKTEQEPKETEQEPKETETEPKETETEPKETETEPKETLPNPNPNPIYKENSVITLKESRFVPPTVEEVRAYCIERGNNIDPEEFVDTYKACGWVIKGTNAKMKDWRAAVRTWEKKPWRKAPAAQKPPANKFDFEQRHTDYDSIFGGS